MRRIICSFLVLATPAVVYAQAPEPGKYSAERHEVKETRGHKASMRDGIHLSVDVYRPDDAGKFPALLIQTPYNNNSAGFSQRAKWFARRGYAVAIADSRGRFDSEGVWDPFDAKHKTDGYDLVEWLAKQSWCSGKVGTLGPSYMGWTQWWTATQAPPSLKVMVPEVAPPDAFRNGPYQEGVLVSWMMDWAPMMAGRTAQVVADGPYGGFANTRARDLMQLPYIKLNERRGALDAPWFERWIRDNLSTSDYWRGISYQNKEDYEKVAVPSLSVTGWFDANFPGSPMNYEAMKRYGPNPQARRPSLVIGPWPHSFNRSRKLADIDYGADAVIDWDGYACRWFDCYLKDIDNGVDKDPPVHVFVMGRNRWHAEKDWPLPQTEWTKFYLHSQGKANALKGDGVLSTFAPISEPPDSYVYDPAQPTPSPFTGGHIDGPSDTRKSASRDDVLVYTTPPLEQDIEVTGPIEAKLYAATSARDTDWMLRLVDVRPDGSTAFLCDGVLRARCRDPKQEGAFNSEKLSEIEPNKTYLYTIRFWRATANVFPKGHRIRIEISSSFYPYYLRNLNTGADNVGLETKTAIAKQKIYHDGEHPSHVVLPVIPAR